MQKTTDPLLYLPMFFLLGKCPQDDSFKTEEFENLETNFSR
nr:hypothetical protein [Mariniradius sediminis]